MVIDTNVLLNNRGIFMIEKYEDLDSELAKIKIKNASKEELDAQINTILQDKLELTLSTLKQELSEYLTSKANDLSKDITNIAPMGDYSNLIEHKDKIEHFLKNEAQKEENWHLFQIDLANKDKKLIQFNFSNTAVDDGDSVKGFVFVDFNGKVKHRFANVG